MSGANLPVRQDASLSLLHRIMDDSLDPSYAEVARRRASGELPMRRRSMRLAVGIVLAVLGLLASVLVGQTWHGQADAARSHAALADRVAEAAALNDRRVTAVERLALEVDELQRAALAGRGDADRRSQQLAVLEHAAALAAVTGPGVEVVLDDGPDSPVEGGGPDVARVLDRDLQLAVNGLLAAGAEAVSVNDRRITATAAIRSAGDAILVGFRPLTRPYVVRAIGDPRTLEARFVESTAGRQLRALADTYAMTFTTSTADQLTLPGEAATPVRYASPRRR